MLIDEMERVLLDQIEKLNDDSLAKDPELARAMIEKSRAMGELAGRITEMNRLKLDVYREANANGGIYEKLLGIENVKK